MCLQLATWRDKLAQPGVFSTLADVTCSVEVQGECVGHWLVNFRYRQPLTPRHQTSEHGSPRAFHTACVAVAWQRARKCLLHYTLFSTRN